MTRPSLDLTVEIQSADGSNYRWGSGARNAGNIPGGLNFSTKRGDGFSTFGTTLSRRIDRDYLDLGLLREITVLGTGNAIAHESRVSGMPRSTNGGQSIDITGVGWMAHAKDRKFQEVYLDQSLANWQDLPFRDEKARLAAASEDFTTFSWARDDGWTLALPQQTVQVGTIGELWYVFPPDCGISKLMYQSITNTGVGGFTGLNPPGFHVAVGDMYDATEFHAATIDDTLHTQVFANSVRYLMSDCSVATTGAVPGGQYYSHKILAVYGNSAIPTVPLAGEPDAVYASDVMRDIVTRFCPKLNADGVVDTSYPLRQCAYTDRTFPYDAFLDLNRSTLFNLSVFEKKTLYLDPVDLTDYDWQVRLGEPGVDIQLHGDDADELANGIAVSYTDLLTGQAAQVTPDDFPELADTDPSNPYNIEGYPHWTELQLSFPCVQADAIQFGIAALAEFNSPKAPGTITVKGHIRDRAGHWQPAWKVRCDDRIAITNYPNDRPRLIVETDYQHDDHSMTIAVDDTFQRIDAVFDRITTALKNANLT